MTFWPLAHLAATDTPLTYGDPPVASRVPSNQRSKEPTMTIAEADANPDSDYSSAVLSLPTLQLNATSTFAPSPTTPSTTPPSSSPTTTICTVIKGQYPTSTLPAFCRPTLYANVPALASPSRTQSGPVSTAIVTMSANSVPDKVSCCAECATYYNCFAWRFVPSYIGTPSERLPGGFDPWRHGNCEIAYHTGVDTDTDTNPGNEDEDGDGGANGGGVTRKGAPHVCPNGRLRRVLNETTAVTGSGSSSGIGGDKWFGGLYFNGWNEGACAADLGSVVFLEGIDPGVGDGSQLCDGQGIVPM
ncbi:hypothetical protein F5Y09DRAFT_326694 [Xylaria sp. FL1042]|nr:hypothetical protein F5Y09DRAFT_326694 [Xylaria sp. FL1042]